MAIIVVKAKSLLKGMLAGMGIAGAAAAIGASGLVGYRQAVRKTCTPFYSDAQRQLVIPGLKDGFDPQDLFYVGAADVWLFSGYNTKKGNRDASPVYKVDASGKVTKLAIQLPNGMTYKGHGAAICATDEHAFLTVKDGYVVLSLVSLLEAKDGDTIRAFAHVPVELEPAFMNTQDGILYIGEFYHKRFYETPKSHWLKCPDKTMNPALMYAYDPSDSPEALFGFTPRPSRVYSIPGEIQGMCVTSDHRVVMSESWGYVDSQLLVYEPDMAVVEDKGGRRSPTYLVAGEKAPLYYLYDGSLEKAIELPPMAEGIDSHDGQVWLANESASDIYLLGKLNDGKYVYSLTL